MSLHLDYRPRTLNDIVGNRALINSLKAILNRDNKPHAYLLTGSTGCGKTTISRIIANKLGCHKNDLIEIDAGTDRGVDVADRILDSVKYVPRCGDVKVYIIDEIQNMFSSKKYQDTLLKSLEEPPNHVYFILCTTDPQKLKKSIRNRCSEFQVSKLIDKQMEQLLNFVLESEGIDDFSEEVLDLVIENADGCPRQALVALDQIINMEAEDRLKIIRQIEVEEKEIIDLCRLLLNSKSTWKKITEILRYFKDNEIDPETIKRITMAYMSSVLLSKENTRAGIILSCFADRSFIENGMSMLILVCYEIMMGE